MSKNTFNPKFTINEDVYDVQSFDVNYQTGSLEFEASGSFSGEFDNLLLRNQSQIGFKLLPKYKFLPTTEFLGTTKEINQNELDPSSFEVIFTAIEWK
ncbi:hypothetical protein KA005_70520, partial [bacterium]|nr:hypothetical protein [bacterium]